MPIRIFIEPNLNAAKSAAKEIFDILNPSRGNFIFSGALVLAPTKSCANALSRELANLSMQKFGGGIAGLEVLTLEAFFSRFSRHIPSAGETERRFAMGFAVGKFSDEDFPALFPNGIPPSPKNFFKKFLEIKTLCAQAGLSIKDAAKKISESANIESDRWEEIEKFDESYVLSLSKISKKDPADALLEALKNPRETPETVFLAGIADAPKILFDALKKFEENGSKIFSLTIAKEALSKHFDAFGIPEENYWKDKIFDIPNGAISVPQTRIIQAQNVANDAAKFGANAADACAIACEEGASAAAIARALASKNIKSFSPEGEKLSDGEIFDFLKTLSLYFSARDFDSLKTIVQKDAMLSFLKHKTNLCPKEIFETIDCYKFEKFALNPETAMKLAEEKNDTSALSLFEAINSALTPDAELNSEKIAQILQTFFAKIKTFDAEIKEEAESISATLCQIKAAEEAFGKASLPETIEILLGAADKKTFGKIRAHGEIQMKNWLEIFWTPEPNLLIADFNDGQVPENISSDAFMPNSLREFLGIRAAKSRHARDSYFLHTILSSREKSAVKIYAPQTDFDGEPLRPSRLLLQTPKPELAARAKHLFQDAESDKRSRAFSYSWKMKVPPAPLPSSLNATDFKHYISCPFGFYLKRVLKLDSVDAKKSELDAMDVGTITHKAFELLVKENTESVSEEAIFAILKRNIEAIFKSNFGKNIPTAIALQKYFILSKLSAAARIEAQHRKNGWRTMHAEKEFKELSVLKFKIKAKIDRIDFNEREGKYLLIDYKTIDTAPNGAATKNHYLLKGGNFVWKDLQLPVYIASAKKFFNSENIEAAYFLIAKSAEETRIEYYKNSPEAEESARKKAEEIAQDILDFKFEPDAKSPLETDYPEYFGFAAKNLEKFLDLSKIKSR